MRDGRALWRVQQAHVRLFDLFGLRTPCLLAPMRSHLQGLRQVALPRVQDRVNTRRKHTPVSLIYAYWYVCSRDENPLAPTAAMPRTKEELQALPRYFKRFTNAQSVCKFAGQMVELRAYDTREHPKPPSAFKGRWTVWGKVSANTYVVKANPLSKTSTATVSAYKVDVYCTLGDKEDGKHPFPSGLVLRDSVFDDFKGQPILMRLLDDREISYLLEDAVKGNCGFATPLAERDLCRRLASSRTAPFPWVKIDVAGDKQEASKELTELGELHRERMLKESRTPL